MRLFLTLVIAFCLGGCSKTWAPGPGQSAQNFEPTKGRCELAAQDSGTGFVAIGAQDYVTGASLGHAIGNKVRSERAFDACMAASGFLEVTPAAQDAVRAQAERVKAILQERRECAERVRTSGRYDALLPRLPDVATGKYTMLQLSATKVATAEEARLFAAYYDETAPCRDGFAEGMQAALPGAGAVLSDSQRALAGIVVQLVHRTITWGNYAQQLRDLGAETGAKLRALAAG